MVGWQLLLIVSYIQVLLFGSYSFDDFLFSSLAPFTSVHVVLALIGAASILMISESAWWRKPIAIMLVLFSHAFVPAFNSFIISSWLMSHFGIDIVPAVLNGFASILSIALPLIAWNLVRERAPLVVAAALAFGVIVGPITVAISYLTSMSLGPIPGTLFRTAVPLLGMLALRLLGNAFPPMRAAPRQPQPFVFISEPEQPVAATYSPTTATSSTYAAAPDDVPTMTPQARALPQTNTLAILALIFSFVIGLVGVILGHVALNQIARTGQEGRGLALTGLVIGYISVVLSLIFSIRAVYLISQLF